MSNQLSKIAALPNILFGTVTKAGGEWGSCTLESAVCALHIAHGMRSYTLQVSRMRSSTMIVRADEERKMVKRTKSRIRWAATRMGPTTTSLALCCDMLVEDKRTRAIFFKSFGAQDLQQLRSVDLVMMHKHKADVYGPLADLLQWLQEAAPWLEVIRLHIRTQELCLQGVGFGRLKHLGVKSHNFAAFPQAAGQMPLLITLRLRDV